MAENLLSLYAQTARGLGNPQNVLANRMTDDEAMANYLAMQPQQPVRNGLDRDALLPWAYEVKDGKRSPTGQFAVPQLGVDVWNAIKSVGSAPLTAPYNPAERDSMIEHAGAVVGPMAGVGIARGAMLPRGAQELGSAGGKLDQPGIRAYHGSPHDFDRFSLDKIGTGEGAQAYGHGLYFAEREGVAKSYRDKLEKKTFDVIVRSGDADTQINFGGLGKTPPVVVDAARAWFKNGGDIDKAIASFVGDKDQFNIRIGQQLAKWKQEGAQLIGEADVPGRMYEVNIKASPEDFLDWDKPLSQQSEKVKKALSSLPSDERASAGMVDQNTDGTWTAYSRNGGQYHAKTRAEAEALLNDPPVGTAYNLRDPATVQQLRESGAAGVRYLDQVSRGKGEGSRNYVVFNDALVEILRKYGLLPPAVAAGALAASNPDQAQARQ